ncbi:fungal-specific transcription factor domain-containing protein [Cyathus striatus]|nr:fungal-specific transcription factor domain-containing protein [Cyathus striatus]
MPVDNTRIIPTRRTQKHITEEELRDIELKRLREGELSCAECRRLKLKCDKKVPCGSCVRRGCESICPCGILSAGQGTRFILASTDQLHRKITEMSHRIRQLEDALAILQSSVSETRHPLLTDDLLKIKFGSEALGPKPEDNKVDGGDGGEGGGIDALGTLTLDESGEVKYFGRSAGSETLMMANDESPLPEQTEPTIPLTPHLENLANLFPFTTKHRRNSSSLEQLESLLPSHERAVQLCELYIDHATLFFRPIKRDELLGRLLPSVYETAAQRIKNRITTTADSPSSDFSSPSPSSHSSDEEIDNTTPHTLASLFFILALGALFDLNLGAFNAEAEHFYNLGRAAMSLRTVFDSPSLATVRALGLMACYCSLGGWKCSRDSAWCIMSFAAKVANGDGVDRDSARWNMDPETVQIRRNLFWEVFASDVSHSLAIGRPPALHLSYVDCELATDDEATLSDTGETQNGFWRMKHIFARDIFTSVAEATLGAKSPSYSTILELDRKVREISFPVHFRPYVSRAEGDALFYSSSASLKAFYASIHRTVTMLYLHRSFFAQAMLDHPANPLLSPFASSFLTAYRCASVIIKASAHQFDRCAEIGMRVWFLLYHTFSAAVIAGTIVTRSSNSSVAPSALIDLDLAVKLFERASIKSQRAKIALGVLRKLGEKAHRAFSQFTSQSTSGLKSQNNILGIFSSQAIDDVEDELAIFGGHTRVLDRKKHRHTQSSSTSSASSPRLMGLFRPRASLLNRSWAFWVIYRRFILRLWII